MRRPGKNKSILTESWQRVRWLEKSTGGGKRFEIFENEYEVVTKKLNVNFQLGQIRKEKGMTDEKFINKIKEYYNIQSNTEYIYTDG